ncbi:hypothetical protein Tco_1390511, partial [Tanacetum coccineum]
MIGTDGKMVGGRISDE